MKRLLTSHCSCLDVINFLLVDKVSKKCIFSLINQWIYKSKIPKSDVVVIQGPADNKIQNDYIVNKLSVFCMNFYQFILFNSISNENFNISHKPIM